MKRLFMILFIGIFFVVGCSNKDNLNKPDDIGEGEKNVDEIEEFDFTISGIISPEKYQRSEKAYSINSGKEVLQVTTTWNPSGARAIIGFIDAKKDEEFWETPQASGSWQGTIQTSHLQAGEYYITVKTEPEINDYDKSERSIVAHFNWK